MHVCPTCGRTHSQLRQSAAQLLRDVLQLLQLGLLLPPILTHNLLLQPLIRLQGEGTEDVGGVETLGVTHVHCWAECGSWTQTSPTLFWTVGQGHHDRSRDKDLPPTGSLVLEDKSPRNSLSVSECPSLDGADVPLLMSPYWSPSADARLGSACPLRTRC